MTLCFRLFAGVLISLLLACDAIAESAEEVQVYYLMEGQDKQYDLQRSYAGLQLKRPVRPLDGVLVGLRESRVIARSLGAGFTLTEIDVTDIDSVLPEAPAYIVADLPMATLMKVVEKYRSRDVIIFNPRHPSDVLRQTHCDKNLFHTVPSDAMLNDALAQYLRKKNWVDVLVLKGKLARDQEISAAFSRSAKKAGLRIVAAKEFVLSHDPRNRGETNIPLMTASPKYDVVFIADSFGEFSRYVPYQTHNPKVVVGSEGLIPAAWHWTWERHGAPQLNQRFRKWSKRSEMSEYEWAGWAAIKTLVTAMSKSRSVELSSVLAQLRSPEMIVDLYKGSPGSFRSWNNQLRQPILLRTHNAVIARAPIDGFLHRQNNLDTLGIDAPESRCRF